MMSFVAVHRVLAAGIRRVAPPRSGLRVHPRQHYGVDVVDAHEFQIKQSPMMQQLEPFNILVMDSFVHGHSGARSNWAKGHYTIPRMQRSLTTSSCGAQGAP
jgi:hypothetical protein